MSKAFPLSLLLILLSILTGCGKKEVTLKFSLPKETPSTQQIVYYASDKKGGIFVETVATLIEGKGELRTPMINPSLMLLLGRGNVPTVIYAERGEQIDITGKDVNPALWTISGNQINEDLSLWRNAHATTLLSGTPEEINEAVTDYVRENPDNPVSPILLLTAFSRSVDEIEFVDLWYSLGEKADKIKWMQMLGRSDMVNAAIRRPGKLISMALRSLANGVDTITPANADATILFFWNNSMDRRRELIDSLKNLANEFPDSASRIIADISVDADSISWRSPLRHDSVKNIARFWIPAGLADRRLISLQVGRLPFFMVVAPNGIQTYRGDDPTKAFEAFRALKSANEKKE